MDSNKLIISDSSVMKFKAQGKEIVYTWYIKNVDSYIDNNNDHVLVSPEFPSRVEKQNRWCLHFHTANDNKEYLTLGLNLNNDDECQKLTHVTMSINDREGKDCISVQNFFVAKHGNFKDRWFDNIVKKSIVCNKENSLLNNGTLTVQCKLFYVNNIDILSFQKSEQTILKNFENLFENKNLSDVVLTVGNQEFKAHKCILSAQSKVFSAMFEHNMIEKNKNEVHINDIKPNIMERLLRFLYSGKVEDHQNIDELLIAADKYELEDLKELCEEELINNTTVDNIGSTLLLADRYRAKELKRCALRFVSLHIKEIDLKKLELDIDKQSSLFIDIIRELSKMS